MTISGFIPGMYLIGSGILGYIVWNQIKIFRAAGEKLRSKLITVYIVIGAVSVLLFFVVNTSGIKNNLFPWQQYAGQEQEQQALESISH